MSAPRGVAWHVGRQGEVAGGMTQVINAYLAWPFEHLQVAVLQSRDGSRGARALWLFLRAAWHLAVRLQDRQREMVVVHLSQKGSFVREGLLLRLAHARGFGTVAHLHGSAFVDFSVRWPRLVRSVLHAADRVIVLSDATRAAAETLASPDSVVLLPNAVPAGNPRPKEPLVVFGGGVGRRKGVDVLVKAWQRAGAGRGWRLIVAGPVVDADVVPPDLADAQFVGGIAHGELMSWLDRSSVAVLPSRDEAMPMFILEAMARDNCVISTTVGGVPAVLEQGCGVLVPPDDVDALACAIDRAIGDPEWRAAIACTGRRRFDDGYAAAAVYPRIEAVWRQVLPAQAVNPEAA